MKYTPRLRTKYSDEIAPKLKEKFEYSSIMQVPKITKICLNQGLGKATADKKIIDAAVDEMTLIAGQKATPTNATKDISNFKLRKGVAIGAKVTLRGDQMYEFLDRLISVALPRTRDFRGVKSSLNEHPYFNHLTRFIFRIYLSLHSLVSLRRLT